LYVAQYKICHLLKQNVLGRDEFYNGFWKKKKIRGRSNKNDFLNKKI